jgi:putative transposase
MEGITMPRANRHVIPGQVWHLTHRCHKKQWLFKFAKDRQRWLYWLFEARQRYGLCVLNYVVTSNHIHLLVKDRGCGEICSSMQLIAGRTAQEYNRRKNRNGAFWEDRYHSTAIESDSHLQRCITYIDLNMVRAGAVEHPGEWMHGGLAEIQNPRSRYKRVDYGDLIDLLCLSSIEQLQQLRLEWVEANLRQKSQCRNSVWTEAVAVGSESFVTSIRSELKLKQPRRQVELVDGKYVLREAHHPLYRVSGVENAT